MKQEAFAVHVARGVKISEAYRLAGYQSAGNSAYVNASKLAKSHKIVTRVASLHEVENRMAEMARQTTMIVTAQTVTAMLAQTFDAATRDKQHGAAATAAMGLAKLHGLLVERHEDVTRRATRDPAAPIEIDVEHWVNEQVPLILAASSQAQEPLPDMGLASPAPAESEPDLPRPATHVADLLEPLPAGALEPQEPEPQEPEPRGSSLDESPSPSPRHYDA